MHPDDAEDLQFDEGNDGHLTRASPLEIFQVWCNEPDFVPNRRGLAATWLMLGVTDGGRALTVPVLCVAATRSLRPITAWESTDAELTRWRGGRR